MPEQRTKTIEQSQLRRSGVFIANFEQFLRIAVSVTDFEHANADWGSKNISQKL